MLRGVYQVFIGAQQNSIMSYAQLSDERVNRIQLHACPAT